MNNFDIRKEVIVRMKASGRALTMSYICSRIKDQRRNAHCAITNGIFRQHKKAGNRKLSS